VVLLGAALLDGLAQVHEVLVAGLVLEVGRSGHERQACHAQNRVADACLGGRVTLPAAIVDVPPSWWGARLGGLPRPFWAIFAGTLVNRLGSFVLPFLSLFLTLGRGYSIGEAGLVLTAMGLGSAISQPIGGGLADHIGRRRTMVGGLVGSGVTLLGLGAAHGLPLMCLSAFVYGVASDLFRPASQAAIADLVPEGLRARAYALIFWALNLGFAVATLVGGFLADRGYWLLFAGDAATSIAFAAIVLRLVPETRPAGNDSTPGSLRDVLQDRLMVGLVLSVLLQSVAYMQAFFTLPLAIVRDGLGTRGYGEVIALNGVLIVALQPLLLGALGRRGRGRLLLSANVVLGIGLGLTAFADGLLMHLLAVTVWTLGEILAAGQLGALVASIAPVHLRGRYMGVFGASFGLSAFLAPGLGTQTLEHLGESTLWAGCLVSSVLAGFGMLLVANAAGRRAP
jgi:MFS family permease